MDATWAVLYSALALVTLRFSWPFPSRRIAWAVLANVGFTNAAGLCVPLELTPATNTLGETMILVAAAITLRDARRTAMVILVLSLVSCLISVAYSAHADLQVLNAYEQLNNGVLIVQCFVLVLTGFWRALDHSFRRHLRWRALRRRARHAGARMGVAPRQHAASDDRQAVPTSR